MQGMASTNPRVQFGGSIDGTMAPAAKRENTPLECCVEELAGQVASCGELIGRLERRVLQPRPSVIDECGPKKEPETIREFIDRQIENIRACNERLRDINESVGSEIGSIKIA